MKVSDFIVQFLVSQGVHHVFVVSGGSAVHMVDSVGRNRECDYICAQHEQQAGAEADGYARISNNLGAVMVTSGPGGTNLATSIANAFYDSIPVLFLCGQVATFRLKKSKKLRQKGFQETDIVEIFTPIAKYAKRINDASQIGYELAKAVYIAREGRGGPVILDIPDDITRAQIDPSSLVAFHPPKVKNPPPIAGQLNKLHKLLQKTQRPVVIVGAGVGLSNTREAFGSFIHRYFLPVVHSWGGADVLTYSDKFNMGPVGVCGPRSGNWAVQNADLIIAIGTRLSQMITGGKQNLFAKGAKKVMIDIDRQELVKFTQNEFLLDLPICADVKDFLLEFQKRFPPNGTDRFSNWRRLIRTWEKDYPICPKSLYSHKKQIQPLVFIKELSKLCKEGDVIVGDTGANLSWFMQAWETKSRQRIISAWSHTPMGYALPAAIGASFVTKERVICLTGDGGLMMCLSELSTLALHKLPIKIFIFNNKGHSIQKQTVETWLEGRYHALDTRSGLHFPDFEKIGQAFGISAITISRHNELKRDLPKILQDRRPLLVNLVIDPDARITPMLKFGSGLEDLDPKISRRQLKKIMSLSL